MNRSGKLIFMLALAGLVLSFSHLHSQQREITVGTHAAATATAHDRSGKRIATVHSLFWRISGADLKTPSYLFGTFHLLESSYVDTMRALREALAQSDLIVGEMVLDSSLGQSILKATM